VNCLSPVAEREEICRESQHAHWQCAEINFALYATGVLLNSVRFGILLPPRWQVATPSSRHYRPDVGAEVLHHRHASGVRKPAQYCSRENPAKIEHLDLHYWR
jgi:hypothetical protein